MNIDFLSPARDDFKKHAKPILKLEGGHNNTYCAMLSAKGDMIWESTWACHGFLANWNIRGLRWLKEEGSPAFVLSAVMTPHKTVKTADLLWFIHWLVNESNWKDVFLSKDAEDILDRGYVARVDGPINFLVNALIATRFPTEKYCVGFDRRWLVFQELLAAGLNYNEAFLFAHIYNTVNQSSLYPITFSPLSTGHNSLRMSPFNKTYFNNFLRNRPQNLSNLVLSRSVGYESGTLTSVWGSEVDDRMKFYERAKKLAPTYPQNGDDLHIFRRIANQSVLISDRDELVSVVSQFKELLNA